MYAMGREGIPFDTNAFMNVILGKKEGDRYSYCWGNNDYELATNGRDQLTDDRKDKDYNSFGETKIIDF